MKIIFDIKLPNNIKCSDFHGICCISCMIRHSIVSLTIFSKRQFSIFFRFCSLFTINIDATAIKKHLVKIWIWVKYNTQNWKSHVLSFEWGSFQIEVSLSSTTSLLPILRFSWNFPGIFLVLNPLNGSASLI